MSTIHIASVLNSNATMSIQEGEIVYDLITNQIKSGNVPVILDFEGVNLVAPPFVHRAIGDLLKEYTRHQVEECLEFRELTPFSEQIIRRCLDVSEG